MAIIPCESKLDNIQDFECKIKIVNLFTKLKRGINKY